MAKRFKTHKLQFVRVTQTAARLGVRVVFVALVVLVMSSAVNAKRPANTKKPAVVKRSATPKKPALANRNATAKKPASTRKVGQTKQVGSRVNPGLAGKSDPAGSGAVLDAPPRLPIVDAPIVDTLVPKGPTVEKVESFFQGFVREHSKPPERSEFQTLDEYEKSLPPPWDSSRLIYLPAELSVLEKGFQYDLDTEHLTIFGGSELMYKPDKPIMGTPVVLLQDFGTPRRYEASNAYGATVEVTEHDVDDYAIYFDNLDSLPVGLFDGLKNRFQVTFKMPPKEAEALTGRKALELIVGVRLKGYTTSIDECTYTRDPTIDRPNVFNHFLLGIEGSLAKILIRNKETSGILYTLEADPAKK